MARTSSFVSGTILGYAYQLGSMLVGLWMTPFILKILNQHDYGVWLVGLQALTFLLLVDFGIVAITPRDVARITGKEKSTGDSEALITLIVKTCRVVLYQTLVVMAGSVVVYYLLPRGEAEIRGPALVALTAFCLSYPLRTFAAVLQGLQDLTFLGRLRIACWVISTVITVVLLLTGQRLYALALGWGFNVFAQEFGAFFRLRYIRPELAVLNPWSRAIQLTWRDFTRGIWLSVGQVAQLLLGGSNMLVAADVLGASSVVVYTCTIKLALVLSNQPLLLAATAVPGLSQMKDSEPRERILEVSTSLGQAMFIISGALVCVILTVNQAFVELWVGPQLFGGVLLTFLSLMNVLLRHIDLTIALSLFSFGYEKPMAIKGAADGLVSAGIAYVCAHWFGLAGVALGYVVGGLLISLPVNAVMFSREFQIPLRKVFEPYVAYTWRLAAACVFGYALQSYVRPQSYLSIAATALAVVSFYSALSLHHMLRTPLGAYAFDLLNRSRAGLRTWGIRWSA